MARTVARDLKTLQYAGVPWYFDKESSSYRLPPKYQFPIRLVQVNANQKPNDDSPTRHSNYIGYFSMDDPMSNYEIHFVARWLHESHNLSGYSGSRVIKWNQRWNMPEAALANFYTVFMNAFNGDTASFFDLVVSHPVVPMGIPWKSESEFLRRDQTICEWLRFHGTGSVVKINEQIDKHRSIRP